MSKALVQHQSQKFPKEAKQEATLLDQLQIVDYVEEYSIPPSLILNFDQTPWKYATLSVKRSKLVAITGSSFKYAITATFGITCEKKFLPKQLIHGQKTKKKYPTKEIFSFVFAKRRSPQQYS